MPITLLQSYGITLNNTNILGLIDIGSTIRELHREKQYRKCIRKVYKNRKVKEVLTPTRLARPQSPYPTVRIQNPPPKIAPQPTLKFGMQSCSPLSPSPPQ